MELSRSPSGTCVLWSGGKDCFTAHLLDCEARGADPSGALLVTCGPSEPAFRCHPVELSRRQAGALGAEHELVEIELECWEASYRAAFGRLAARGVRRLVTGDMVREPWLAEACRASGLELVLPLFGWPDPERVLDEMERLGVLAVVSGARAEHDRPGLLGGVVGRELLEATGLRDAPGFHPCGENGEYHSAVVGWRGRSFVDEDLTRLPRVERDGVVSLELPPFAARALG